RAPGGGVRSRPRRREAGCARHPAGARVGRGVERRSALRGVSLLHLRRRGLCGSQRRRWPAPLRLGGCVMGALMSKRTCRWWRGAVLAGVWWLAVALPEPVNHELPLRGVLRSELQSYLVQQLSQYLRSPAVRARALVRVSVQGGVVRPGYYAVPADALVADALMAAGGTLPTSKPGKMRLERGGDRLLDGKELAQAVAQGRTLDDLNVQDGDQLVVPKEGAGVGDNLRFLWVVISITGGIVGLTKVFGH